MVSLKDKEQTHCPNKLIVNNLPKEDYFIYSKDVKEAVNRFKNYMDEGMEWDVIEKFLTIYSEILNNG